jgi:hypothetical protein
VVAACLWKVPVSGCRRLFLSRASAGPYLPALCGEGGAHGDRSRSREPAGRCLGGHCEVVLAGVARIVLEGCNGW